MDYQPFKEKLNEWLYEHTVDYGFFNVYNIEEEYHEEDEDDWVHLTVTFTKYENTWATFCVSKVKENRYKIEVDVTADWQFFDCTTDPVPFWHVVLRQPQLVSEKIGITIDD